MVLLSRSRKTHVKAVVTASAHISYNAQAFNFCAGVQECITKQDSMTNLPSTSVITASFRSAIQGMHNTHGSSRSLRNCYAMRSCASNNPVLYIIQSLHNYNLIIRLVLYTSTWPDNVGLDKKNKWSDDGITHKCTNSAPKYTRPLDELQLLVTIIESHMLPWSKQ